MTPWAAALDAYETSVERAERGLRDGTWDDPPAWTTPSGRLGPPSKAEIDRLRVLRERVARCVRDIEAAMAADRTELMRGRTARTAVRSYRTSGR